MKLRINIKAVAVLIFGVFCLYCYFRLINPYLDVGSVSVMVPENIFSRKIIQIEGNRYSYWTNNVINPRKTVVMLPPSTATGDYFGRYAEVFPPDVLIIAPDYPGRGLTDGLKDFDTIPLLAGRVEVLLKEVIGTDHFDIVAPSFGGMIGTRLAQNGDLNIDKIFLVATGEFFAPDQKFMYRTIFYPAKYSERLRNRYVSILTSGNVFTNLQDTNIEDMLEQWLTTIDYKIDTDSVSNVPATIIIFSKDNVVRPESTAKLERVFKNNSVVSFDLTHTSPSFFSKELFGVLIPNI